MVLVNSKLMHSIMEVARDLKMADTGRFLMNINTFSLSKL